MKLLSTLQRTLSLHFLLVAILPALAFGIITLNLLHKHLQADVYERNRILSRDIAAATDQFLVEVERDLATVARVVEAKTILRPEVIDAFLEQMVVKSERFESLYRLDRDYRIVNLGLDPSIRKHLEDYRHLDFSQHDLLRQQRVIDRPLWSDTFISVVTGQPSVTLALPLADGILLGNINLQSLNHQLASFTMGEGDNCAIIDHVGTLVAFSNPQLAARRSNFKFHLSVERALQGTADTLVEHHDNLPMLESTAIVARTGWISWVGVDLGAKMIPVDNIRNLLLGIMVLAVLFGGGFALVDARRLLTPLSALSVRAGQIGAGRYNLGFAASGFDEIDRVAASLQLMAQEIRNREQSLISSEQRFRNLVNSIDGVVWEMDLATGRYLFVSDRSLSLLGHPPAQWLDNPDFWSRFVHPADLEYLKRLGIQERRDLVRNAGHDLEYRFISAGGVEVWVRDLISLAGEHDKPSRLLGVMISIMDRKRAEAELARYRAHLEELVTQRTRELQAAQNELVQKERLAILGQLTATVSHEIRNPLGTVSNALYLMRETLGSDCLRRIERPLALAERSIQRCDGIISELFDFTRQRELERVPVRIDPWLAGVLDEMVWPANVRCHWHLASAATVLADPERLRQALVNVVANALQAMDEKGAGEQRLEIRTRHRANRCEIEVSDSGCGIPEQIRERIFEPLFSTKSFGVGLGVPIIRNIMTDHGGGVVYQSKMGEGTTVTLWLPLEAPGKAPGAEG